MGVLDRHTERVEAQVGIGADLGLGGIAEIGSVQTTDIVNPRCHIGIASPEYNVVGAGGRGQGDGVGGAKDGSR